MFQEPIEGLSFLSADNAFPGDKMLEVSQVLPVLQLGSFEFGTILAEMVRVAGTRESLIRAHPPAAPAKMPMSLALPCHGQIEKLGNLLFDIYRYFSSTQAPPPIKFVVAVELFRLCIAELQTPAIYVVFEGRPQ